MSLLSNMLIPQDLSRLSNHINMTNDDRKNIVIVGGGAGGSRTAHLLSTKLDESKFNLILIDPRSEYILLPASGRVSVADPEGLEETILIPLKDVFLKNRGTFIQAEVTSIEKSESGGHVTLSTEQRIQFDILVLSPGSKWAGPFGFPATGVREFFSASRAAIKAAQNIALIGAGAVGAELAGEIIETYPKKSITIIQADKQVLNNAYPDKFRRALERRLRQRNIKLVFEDYVDDLRLNNGILNTRSGKSFKADLVLKTFGPKPNTEFIARSLGADVLSDRGLVRVRPTLQLSNHPDIYAVGDVVDYPEQKQAGKAINHANVVVTNIIASFQNKSLVPYKGSKEMIIVSLGKSGGVAYADFLWGLVFGDWFCRMVKTKDLMAGMMRGLVGL